MVFVAFLDDILLCSNYEGEPQCSSYVYLGSNTLLEFSFGFVLLLGFCYDFISVYSICLQWTLSCRNWLPFSIGGGSKPLHGHIFCELGSTVFPQRAWFHTSRYESTQKPLKNIQNLSKKHQNHRQKKRHPKPHQTPFQTHQKTSQKQSKTYPNPANNLSETTKHHPILCIKSPPKPLSVSPSLPHSRHPHPSPQDR